MKDLDTISGDSDEKPNHETPVAETVQLKEAEPQDTGLSKEVYCLNRYSKDVDFRKSDQVIRLKISHVFQLQRPRSK